MAGGSRSCATRRRSPRSRRASRRELPASVSCAPRSPSCRRPLGPRSRSIALRSSPARAARRPCRDRADTRLRGRQDAPFLERVAARGLELTLAHPDALAAQLRAVVAAGAGTRLRLLLPLVETAQQVSPRPFAASHHAGRASPVLLGAMIETPTAARRAKEDRARGRLSLDRHERSRCEHTRCGASCRSPRLRRRPIPPSSHMSRPWSRRARGRHHGRGLRRGGRYPGARGALRRSRRRRAQCLAGTRRPGSGSRARAPRPNPRLRLPGRRSGRLCRGRARARALR